MIFNFDTAVGTLFSDFHVVATQRYLSVRSRWCHLGSGRVVLQFLKKWQMLVGKQGARYDTKKKCNNTIPRSTQRHVFILTVKSSIVPNAHAMNLHQISTTSQKQQ